ncbi:hypothetical protein YC2023_024219 [Brassica napus]
MVSPRKGEFNQIAHFAEHSNLYVNHIDPPMSNFRNTLTQTGLFDLRYLGPLFTWSNKSPTLPIAKKLDRLLVNHPWIASHPHSQATFLAPEISDHCPAVLDLAVDLPRAGTKPFKFYNFLTKHPNFCQLVGLEWNQCGGTGMDLSHLCYKLKQIKRVLKKINRENYSNIQERVIETNGLLKVAQVKALSDPTTANFLEEKTLMEKFNFLRSLEESYFRQRSRISWLKEGDQNTTFFHRLTQVRNSNNSIRSFCLANGAIISDPIAMGQIAITHFQNILAPVNPPPSSSSVSWFHSLSEYRCPQQSQVLLSSKPDTAEITSTLHKLNPNKSPGPDGLTSGFFKAAWVAVGPDVIAGIRSFFISGHLPPSCNSTILSLLFQCLVLDLVICPLKSVPYEMSIIMFAFRVSVSSEKPRNIPRKFRGTLVFPRNFLGIFRGFSEEHDNDSEFIPVISLIILYNAYPRSLYRCKQKSFVDSSRLQ